MILPDVNVLVYAHHSDSDDHDAYRTWWEEVVNGPGAFGISDLVLSGFVRVTTHPRIFTTPMKPEAAVTAAEAIRSRANAVPTNPGERHWNLFRNLLVTTKAKGNSVPDAFIAAIAIEHGSELATCDRGFARYPGLAWRHPLDL